MNTDTFQGCRRTTQLRVIEGGKSDGPGKSTVSRCDFLGTVDTLFAEMTEKLKKIFYSEDFEIKTKAFSQLNAGSMEIDLRRERQSGDKTAANRKNRKTVCLSDAEMHLLIAKFYMIFDLGNTSQVAILTGSIEVLAEQITKKMKAGNAL